MRINKNNSFLLFIIILLGINLKAQVNDLSKLIPPPKKGLIKLMDGNEIFFKTFKFQNDTVFFLNKENVQQQIPAKNIYKVTRTGNYALNGALSCAAAGLLGAVIGTSNRKYIYSENKEEYIIVATIASGIIGGIIGALFKREKVVYKSNNFNFGINSIMINPVSVPSSIGNFGKSQSYESPIILIGIKIKV
jgi:hypothetical protein